MNCLKFTEGEIWRNYTLGCLQLHRASWYIPHRVSGAQRVMLTILQHNHYHYHGYSVINTYNSALIKNKRNVPHIQYKEIQMGSGAKDFLIYEEMHKYLTIYEEAIGQIWVCNRSPSEFPYIWGNFFIIFFISCGHLRHLYIIIVIHTFFTIYFIIMFLWLGLGKIYVTIIHTYMYVQYHNTYVLPLFYL